MSAPDCDASEADCNDGLPDLVINSSRNGRSSADTDLRIYTWTGSDYERGEPVLLPCHGCFAPVVIVGA